MARLTFEQAEQGKRNGHEEENTLSVYLESILGSNVSDRPYITATGGTTLPWTGTLTGTNGSATVTVTSQRTWGWDYLWPAIAKITGLTELQAAEANIGGSGGGFSRGDRNRPSGRSYPIATKRYVRSAPVLAGRTGIISRDSRPTATGRDETPDGTVHRT